MNDLAETNLTTKAQLLARRNELLRRLNDGDERIAHARRMGTDTAQWETHWIALLRDYELVCQEIANAGSAAFARAA
jgi:hypothetical protein